jgi:hypothetical protein
MPCLAAARPAASRRTFRHASLPPASAVFSAPRPLLCGLERRARVRAWAADLGGGRPGGKATGEGSNFEIECRTFESMLGQQGLAWGWIRSCSQLGEVLW